MQSKGLSGRATLIHFFPWGKGQQSCGFNLISPNTIAPSFKIPCTPTSWYHKQHCLQGKSHAESYLQLACIITPCFLQKGSSCGNNYVKNMPRRIIFQATAAIKQMRCIIMLFFPLWKPSLIFVSCLPKTSSKGSSRLFVRIAHLSKQGWWSCPGQALAAAPGRSGSDAELCSDFAPSKRCHL